MEWYEGFTRPFKSLFGIYSPEEKKALQDNFKKAQGNKTSLGEAVQITGNVLKNGGQYNPNDLTNYIPAILVGLVALILLKD